MTKETTLDKLNRIASKEPSKWHEKAAQRIEDSDWQNKSAKIAIRILREIRKQKKSKNMSQKKLAEELGVSPQYVNKIVKGRENLTLETISKIEKALGIVLMEIPLHDSSHTNSGERAFDEPVLKSNSPKNYVSNPKISMACDDEPEYGSKES